MKSAIFAAVAAVCAAQPAHGHETANHISSKQVIASCGKPPYPKEAQRSGRSGIVEAGFLAGPDGTVVDTMIATSSSVSELDKATMYALLKCRFSPEVLAAGPKGGWQVVRYAWMLEPPGAAAPEFLTALESGPPAAHYYLSLMYSTGYGVAKDSATSVRWLRSAAERGFPMAQYALGEAYEVGTDLAKDEAEAVAWYRKAAALGNIFARDRLRFGFGDTDPEPAVR